MAVDAGSIVGVAGVVTNAEGQVLLVRTEHAGWELPGGRAEPGEDFVNALVREVREESGCEVVVGRLAGVSSNTSSGAVVFTFRCSHASGEPEAGDDSLDAGWVAPVEAVRLVTHPAELTRLRDGLDQGDGIPYRVYRTGADGPVQHADYRN